MAVVMRDGQLSSWIEKSDRWQKLREVWVHPELSVEEATSWAPTVSLRQDAGTMEIDRVTLLAPASDPTDPDPTDPDPTDPDPTDPDPTDPGPTDPTDPDPTDPGEEQPGDAVMPSIGALTEATRGGFDAPATVRPGELVTIIVERGEVGQSVYAWMFSTPTAAGSTVLGADRAFAVHVPEALAAGRHRLVVSDAAGAVLGWQWVTVAADPAAVSDAERLPATGVDVAPGLITGAILLLAGLAVFAVRMMRRRRLAD
jgi:hypothetical protein